jgi:hypothetical protein
MGTADVPLTAAMVDGHSCLVGDAVVLVDDAVVAGRVGVARLLKSSFAADSPTPDGFYHCTTSFKFLTRSRIVRMWQKSPLRENPGRNEFLTEQGFPWGTGAAKSAPIAYTHEQGTRKNSSRFCTMPCKRPEPGHKHPTVPELTFQTPAAPESADTAMTLRSRSAQ